MAAKILIVDDQRLFSECLSGILSGLGASDIAEVRMTGSGEEALKAYPWYRPDLVLLDIFMPGMGGLEALRQLRVIDPTAKIVMLTTFGYDTYVKEALAGGASGYLLKDTTPQEVLASIRTVLGGQTVLSPAVADALAGRARPGADRSSVLPSWFALLSEKAVSYTHLTLPTILLV